MNTELYPSINHPHKPLHFGISRIGSRIVGLTLPYVWALKDGGSIA